VRDFITRQSIGAPICSGSGTRPNFGVSEFDVLARQCFGFRAFDLISCPRHCHRNSNPQNDRPPIGKLRSSSSFSSSAAAHTHPPPPPQQVQDGSRYLSAAPLSPSNQPAKTQVKCSARVFPLPLHRSTKSKSKRGAFSISHPQTQVKHSIITSARQHAINHVSTPSITSARHHVSTPSSTSASRHRHLIMPCPSRALVCLIPHRQVQSKSKRGAFNIFNPQMEVKSPSRESRHVPCLNPSTKSSPSATLSAFSIHARGQLPGYPTSAPPLYRV
jgi:hypothetical protein